MPIIEFWPNEALGPMANPDRFDVYDGEAERIRENIHLVSYLPITGKNDEKYGVFVRNYRYVHFCKSAEPEPEPEIELPGELPPTQE